MHRDRQAAARRFFYRPFYDAGRGHIVGLATTAENMRDGLAIAQIARLFPLFEYPGIVVEPGRRSIQPGENLIVVGWASLFIDSAPVEIPGKEAPVSVGKEKFERIVRLYDRCSYNIGGRRKRIVENSVTGQRYEPFLPKTGDARRLEVDYGVIRRWFRGPTENTIAIEGLHRVGTIGAAKAASDPVILEAIRDAVDKLDGYDDTLPLEILVRAEFYHDDDEIYSLDRVVAKPLMLAYNGHWLYDFEDGLSWKDELPWDVDLGAAGEALPRPVPRKHRDHVPRLELRADLRDHDGSAAELCRELLTLPDDGSGELPPLPEERARPWVEALIAESDRFDAEIWEMRRSGGKPRAVSLPDRSGTRRDLRKRFLIHLALCRLVGHRFSISAASIRRNYPEFRPELKQSGETARDKELESKFIGQIPGKWRDGLAALLGDSKKKNKNYVDREYDSRKRTYALKLKRAMLVLKLRL